MKRKILFAFFTFIIAFLSLSGKAKAAIDCPLSVTLAPNKTDPKSITLKFDGSKIAQELAKYPAGELKFSFPGMWNNSCGKPKVTDINNPTFGPINYDGKAETRCDDDLLSPGEHKVELIYEYSGQTKHICNVKTYTVQGKPSTCKVEAQYSGLGDVDDTSWKIVVSDTQISSPYSHVSIKIDGHPITIVPPAAIPSFPSRFEYSLAGSNPPGFITIPSARTAGMHTAAVYALQVNIWDTAVKVGIAGSLLAIKSIIDIINTIPPDLIVFYQDYQICSTKFEIAPRGATPRPTTTPIATPTTPPFCAVPPCSTGDCSGQCNVCPGCPGAPQLTSAYTPDYKPLCDQLDPDYRDKCNMCLADGRHIWSAIGCLPTDFSVIIKDYVFTIGMGIAGGIAFLYFLYGAFLILTCGGNHEQIEQAKQIIMSALSGLLLIIFSVFLLKVIGVDILRLPGFG